MKFRLNHFIAQILLEVINSAKIYLICLWCDQKHNRDVQSKFRDEKKEVGETGKLSILAFKIVIKVWFG